MWTQTDGMEISVTHQRGTFKCHIKAEWMESCWLLGAVRWEIRANRPTKRARVYFHGTAFLVSFIRIAMSNSGGADVQGSGGIITEKTRSPAAHSVELMTSRLKGTICQLISSSPWIMNSLLQRSDATLNRSCRGLHGDHVDIKEKWKKWRRIMRLQTRDLIFIA